jgi:hypothetical protein
MKNVINYSIVLLVALVLGLGILKLFHLRVGIFEYLIPFIFAILVLLVVVKLLNVIPKGEK